MVAENEGGGFGSAGWHWIREKFIEHWPALLVAFGGVAMTYLAAVSHWLAAYGPVAWGGVGIGAILALAFAYWIYGVARFRIAEADVRRMIASIPKATNPLRTSFENERLKVADFYAPYSPVNDGKSFHGCELIGPGTIAILGGSLRHVGFVACDVIAIAEDVPVRTAAAFQNSNFRDCKFVSLTVLLPAADAMKLRDESMKDGKPTISVIGLGDRRSAK